MSPLVLFGLIVGLPIVLIFLFRINGVTAFLAVCAGDVLQRFAGNDAASVIGSFSSKDKAGATQLGHLILFLLPLLFAVFLLRKSVSKSKSLINLIPAIAAGVLTGILAVPLLPGGVHHNIVTTPLWSKVNQNQSVIVIAVMAVGFFMLWLISPKPDKDKDKKRKK